MRHLLWAGSSLLALAAVPMTAAHAQANVEEVVVTSSRAAQTGFAASTPTTVVSSETLSKQGITNVGQVVFQNPAFKATLSPSGNDVKSATPGQSTAELRGLGGQRTLVLVNGMRVVPEAPATNTSVPVTTDLNTIPSMMIDRMEVVTGGASAQWGSDAVAGVVNIILKNKFQGLQLQAQGGQAEVGDYKNGKLGAIAGTAFSGGRGHIVGAVEYERNNGLGDYTSRDYLDDNWQIIQNTARATNGGPAFLRVPNVVSALGASGLITGPANFSLRNFTFNDGGQTLRPFAVGSVISGVEQLGGEGEAAFKGVNLVPAFRRLATYARGSYDLTDYLTATAEVSYSQTTGILHGTIPRLSAITIQRDNAYLPASVVSAMNAANITSFTMNRFATDMGNSLNTVKNKTPHAAFGLEGKLPGDWSWDAHAAYGENKYDQVISNSAVTGRYTFAQDAVLSGGQIVCRATLPGASFNAAAAGCVPINLFGNGSPSAAARAYVQQTAHAQATYNQTNATFNIRGKPFSTWAGPVSIGAGLEYRHEEQEVITDPIAQAGGFLSLGNATAFKGDFSTKEIYLDTITPLARDMAFAKSLDLTAAVRVSDYTTIGQQTTWKVGGAWEPVTGLKFRVTESKDIRAPAIYELFGGGQLITTSVSVRGQSVNIPQNFTGGNPNLKAESAKTFTAGIVLEPTFAPGLRMSLDYYDIKITDAITNLISQNIATLCTQGSQYFCNLFTFNAQGVPTSLIAPAQNLAEVQTQGYDFAVSYNRDLSGMPGLPNDSSIALSMLGTYVAHTYIDTGAVGGARVDRAGENTEVNSGAIPHLRLNFSESLTLGPATITAQQLYVGGGKIDNTYNTSPALTINDNDVPAVFYMSVFANYRLGKGIQLFGAVDNLLDKAPPQAPYPVFPVPGVNGQYYDKVGRAYRIGVTYTY